MCYVRVGKKKPCSLYDFNKDSLILHRGVKDVVRNREIRKKKKKKVRNVFYHMIKKTEG